MFDDKIDNEIYNSMQEKIIKNQSYIDYKLQKIVKAGEYLKNAAELFEKAGMKKESSEIKNLIKSCINVIKSSK